MSEDHSSTLIVGGKAEGFPLRQWPHFHGTPLAYLARYADGFDTYYVFLDGPHNEVDHSWQPEDGSNAVLRVSDGLVGEVGWITLSGVDSPLERLTSVYNVEPTSEPMWLQGEEYQEGYNFVGQIDSDLDTALNIGDAHGIAYLFIDNVRGLGRLVWQS